MSSCLKEFDEYAADFVKGDKDKRQKVLQDAEASLQSLKDPQKRKSADIYIKVMNKIVEKGDEFVDKEWERVKKLQNGKITKEKKTDMQSRMNILQSFKLKDEL